MLNMILPMTIATIGYFLAYIGSETNMRFVTALGVLGIIVAVLWFIYSASYNIGYMLA